MDLDPDLEPNPDPLARGTDPGIRPHQIVTDPQHCEKQGESRRYMIRTEINCLRKGG